MVTAYSESECSLSLTQTHVVRRDNNGHSPHPNSRIFKFVTQTDDEINAGEERAETEV